MLVVHEDGLDAAAVPQPPQVLDRAVDLTHLFARHGGHGQDKPPGQPLPQVFGQVGHLFKGLHAPVKPFEDLSRAERLLAHVRERCFQLFDCQGFDLSHGVLLCDSPVWARSAHPGDFA